MALKWHKIDVAWCSGDVNCSQTIVQLIELFIWPNANHFTIHLVLVFMSFLVSIP